MSNRTKGTVTAIGKGKYDGFYLMLDGEKFYYNTKFNPKVGVGDVAGIEYEKSGDIRGNVTKVKLMTDNGGPKGFQADAQPAKRSGGGKSFGGGGFNDPARQDSIVYQSSRKDALQLVELLLSNGAFALKGTADAKRVQIEELLDEITVTFFKAAEAPRDSAAFKTAAAVATDSGGDDDSWDADADDDTPDAPADGGWDDWDD